MSIRGGEEASAEYRESLAAEYVARAARLAPLLPRLRPLPAQLLYPARNLALELEKSILYEDRSLRSGTGDSLWNGKPQQYFESMKYGGRPSDDDDPAEYDSDSLAP